MAELSIIWGDLKPRESQWSICVTGGRAWEDRAFVYDALDAFEMQMGIIDEIAHGAAKGVDTMCKDWAEGVRVHVKPYPADWDRYGDAAGSIRNEQMLRDYKPDVLLVFPGGTGTQNCARHARKMGIPRVFFNEVRTLAEEITAWG